MVLHPNYLERTLKDMNENLERQLFHAYMTNIFKHKEAKPLFLIVGRTASGKSTVEAQLNQIYNAEPIKSYTTRPTRPNDETHTFVDQKRFDELRNSLVAYTKINDYEYGVTAHQIIRGSFYVIDPVGVEYLVNSGFFDRQKHIYPTIIHLDVPEDVRLERFLKRGGTKEAFVERQKSEDIAFAPLDSLKELNPNLVTIDGTQELSMVVRQISTLFQIQQKLLYCLKPYWSFETTIADSVVSLARDLEDRKQTYKYSVAELNEKAELAMKRVQNLDFEPMLSVSEMENCSIEEQNTHLHLEIDLMDALRIITLRFTDLYYHKVKTGQLSLDDATRSLDRLYASLTLNLALRTDEFLERLEGLKIKYKDTLENEPVSPSITRDDIPLHLFTLPEVTSDNRKPNNELEIALYLPEHIKNAINPRDMQLLIQALDANVTTFLEDPARYRQILEQAIPRKKG
mgnify:CR=1 FL=1